MVNKYVDLVFKSNSERDNTNINFIHTYRGFLFYWGSLMFVFASFLRVSDLLPRIADTKASDPGLFIKNSAGVLEFALAIWWIPFSIAVVVLILNRINAPKYLILVSSLIVFVITYSIVLWFNIAISTTGGFFTRESIAYQVGIAGLLAAIGWMTIMFSSPLVPERVYNSNEGRLYISNQWKMAQGILTVSIALIVGAMLQFIVEFTDFLGFLPFILLLGGMLTPVFTDIIIRLLRIRLVERQIMIGVLE